LDKELIESFRIPKLEAKVRLSDCDPELFQSIHSKSALKKKIRKELIFLNGNPGLSGNYVVEGDLIEVYKSDSSKVNAQIHLDLDLLYEDEYLAVINKPPGILVSGNKKRTVEHALRHNLKVSNESDALEFPEAIHRLDFATSGSLLIGKTKKAVIELNRLFENRAIEKKYNAICIGEIDQEGEIKSCIEGKEAHTSYSVLESKPHPKYGSLNLLDISLHTGRRNQIRIHLLQQGNPIFGDQKYGIEGLVPKGVGLFLHSRSMSFAHPFTEEIISVEAPLPSKFEKLMNK